jgi:membrane-bound lytic murein transglycosylase
MACDILNRSGTEKMEAKVNKKEKALNALREIRERIKPRKDTEEKPKEETTEEEYKGARIRDEVESGKTKIFFPRMPSEKVRGYLKKHGCEWNPAERCWECERKENAGYHARKAIDRGEVERKD